jgi:hypothetical protein
MGAMTLCGTTTTDARDGRWHCTRERGHAGPHIATIGPYEAGLAVLAEWVDPAPPFVTRGVGFARVGVTREGELNIRRIGDAAPDVPEEDTPPE